METTPGDKARQKLAEAARWKDRFQTDLNEYRLCRVRWMTYRTLADEVSSIMPVFDVIIRRISQLLNRRSMLKNNMDTALRCAKASEHAARLLFEEEEREWT